MAYRVAIGGVYHETNTFSPRPTDLAAFRGKRWAVGEDLRAVFEGTRTVVGGFFSGAEEAGLQPVPVFGAYATPAGTVSAEAFSAIRGTLIRELENATVFDGVLLELHGAMVVDGDPDPEVSLLRAFRDVVGRRPIVGVTDLHANMSAERVELLDVLIGYRTNPHVDTFDRGRQAARQLRDVLDGTLQPVTAHRRIPVVASPIAQPTATEPLRSLMARADALCDGEVIADATVHGGYAYADVPHLGMSVTVTADRDAAAAEAVAGELAGLAWNRRHDFDVTLPAPAEAFAAAARGEASASGAGGRGPVAIADTGDNINGGAPGDATWLIAEAIRRPGVRTLATVWDPELVRTAETVGPGAPLRASTGGRSAPGTGEPVTVDGTVVWVGAGAFTNRGPMSTGLRESMGRVAVVRAGGLDLVVQSAPVQPNDPELFRCCGVEPTEYDVVLLKGAAAVRAGWQDEVAGFVDAGSPGVTDCALERLSYARARRPLWPLDRRDDDFDAVS